MGRVRRGWLWTLLFCSSELLRGADAVTVYLYDYSGLSRETIARAEREASRIYRHSNLEVSWIRCPTPDGKETGLNPCRPADQAPVISLSILPAGMEGRMRESAGLAGRGLVSGIAVGGHAYVFQQRVVEACGNGKYPQDVVLGHLMAHELGHVLLGENSHSPLGLMSAKLSPRDLRLALDGMLFFDSNQAVRMKDRLSRQRVAER